MARAVAELLGRSGTTGSRLLHSARADRGRCGGRRKHRLPCADGEMTGVTPTHPFASGTGLGSLPRASQRFLLAGGAAVAVYPFLPSDAQSIGYVVIGLA